MSPESTKPLCGYQPRSQLHASPELMLLLRNPSWAIQRGQSLRKVPRILGSAGAGLFKSQLPHCLPPTSSLRLTSWWASVALHGPCWLAPLWSKGEGPGPWDTREHYFKQTSNKHQLGPTAGPHATLTANCGDPGRHPLFIEGQLEALRL